MNQRARLIQASKDMGDLSELVFAYIANFDDPLERSDAATLIGRISGIALAIGWMAKYEMEDNE